MTFNDQLDPLASAEEVALAMRDLPVAWPEHGTLVVELNEGHENSHTWLPWQLVSPPICQLDLHVELYFTGTR